MLTVDEAEALIREYWAAPIGTELAEAARLNRMRALLLWEIEARQWRELFLRLGGEIPQKIVGAGKYRHEFPLLLPLLALIDRRPRLGIRSPEATPSQAYRQGRQRRKTG